MNNLASTAYPAKAVPISVIEGALQKRLTPATVLTIAAALAFPGTASAGVGAREISEGFARDRCESRSITNLGSINLDQLLTSSDFDLAASLLRSYESLSSGWDGEHSHAPAASAINSAIGFLGMIPVGITCPEISLTAEGKPLLYWSREGSHFEIEFGQGPDFSIYASRDAVEIFEEGPIEDLQAKFLDALARVMV